ncbi:MAG: phosphoenolpyruvate-utilizing protein [Actinomycetia bacterium]|nr:phosphoenolpyruvate-utilizing protein [Actinomycetes bacterium]
MDEWLVETNLSQKFPFYTRANVGEVFPDPVAPLSFSYFEGPGGLGGSEMGFRDAFVKIGAFTMDEFPDDECLFLGVTGGYCYLNASAMRVFGHRAPGMTAQDIDDTFFGAAPGVPEFVVRDGYDRPECTKKVGETFGWVLTTDGLPEVATDEELVDRLRLERPDFSAMSDRELVDFTLDRMDTHFRHLFGQHIFVTFMATLPLGVITAVATGVGQPEAVLKLVAGVGDVESAAPSMAMWDLGRIVAGSAPVGAAFDKGIDGLDARLRGSDDASVQAWLERFDEFLFSYGCRGPNEWEMRSPTWETEPDLALAAIDRMRLSPESAAPQGHNAERAEEREALGASIAEMVAGDPEAHGQFMAALSAAKTFLAGRERTKTNCIKLIQEGRMAMRELGRRQVDAGNFPQIRSFGLLTRTELFEFLDNPDGWRQRLDGREAMFEEAGAIQEPFLFVGEAPPMSSYPRRDAVVVDPAVAGDALQGVSGCPGKARGIARVVVDSHDPSALAPGDILVAPITDPSWTPLFVPASAVVVDVGAPLSHAIIVSRELGIPCVVSVTDATKKIVDGALIEVDGDTGMVTVLE